MFKKIKKNLLQVGSKEPLNWFSILVLLALDIFIIYNLFAGLDAQKRQLTSPWEKVPRSCENVFNKKFNSDSEKISFIQSNMKKDNNYNKDYYSYRGSSNNGKDIILECISLKNNLESLSKNNNLIKLFSEKKIQEFSVNENNNLIENVVKDYDTNLLEKIAGQRVENSITSNNSLTSKQKINIYNQNIQHHEYQISQLKKMILENSSVKNIFDFINLNKVKVKEILDNEKFWYPLKSYGVQLLFLIPLFIIFWLIYIRVSRNGSSITTLIFSHALVITFIPIFFGILEFIYSIIPHAFLSNFLKMLEDMNLEVLIFPLMILAGILGAMFTIYIVQKKMFNKEKTMIKRLSKEECPYCGVHISSQDLHCYNCGEIQYVKCSVCDKTTKKEGLHCTSCGSEKFKELKQKN